MKIIECYIENFGKISQQKFTFKDGFNCILQNNGEGKTTLSVFIKVMLYGMSDTKRQLLLENERRHYLPWQGGVCGGYLVVEAGGKVYRIERTFASKAADDTYKRVDVATGNECFDTGESFGTDIFGIDAESFERTVFHSERALSSKTNNKTVSAKLSDLVGTDGDIGGMDDAVKSLEEQRKFYQKRGGSGKIADIRAQISQNEERLASLSRTEAELSELDAEIERTSLKMKELESLGRKLVDDKSQAVLARSQSGNVEKYAALKAEVDELVARKDALIDFFGGQVPTVESLEKASLYHARATEMYEKIKEREADSEEYAALSERFSGRITREDAALISSAVARERSREREREALRSSRFGELFKNRVPTAAETDSAIDNLNAKARGMSAVLPTILLVLALACGVCGFFVNAILYAVAGALALVSIVLFIVSASTLKRAKAKQSSALEQFFTSVSGSVPRRENMLEVLYEMRAELKRVPDANAGRDDRELLTQLCAELGADTSDTLASSENILAEFEKYERLKMQKALVEESLRKERSEADRLMIVSRAFTLKYKTAGEDPFAEIRERLAEYTELTSQIVTGRARLAGLSLPSVELKESKSTLTPEEIDAQIKDCDAKRAELERACGALMKRKSECETALLEKDSIAATIAELKEEYKDAEDRLAIILLTQKYLELAKDNITARYLGKTKESFAKYVSLLTSDTDGDFEMDTTFEVSRIERGGARPLEAYSKGTRELYNLAAKMALCDSLYSGELPFLIFDDPFASFDDSRVKSALALLKKLAQERQIIYLTCSASRA